MNIQEGMTVYGESGQQLGRVEQLHGDGFHVQGQHYGRDSVIRVDHNRIYVRGTGMTGQRARTRDDQAEGERDGETRRARPGHEDLRTGFGRQRGSTGMGATG